MDADRTLRCLKETECQKKMIYDLEEQKAESLLKWTFFAQAAVVHLQDVGARRDIAPDYPLR